MAELTATTLVRSSAPDRDVPGVPFLRGFRPDVQALRGLAVVLVVLYHAQWPVPGGYVGVDVFFVISGFVIGRRLVAGLAASTGEIMKDFYTRRARRILPALSVLLVAVILLAPLLAPIGGAAETSRTGVAAALFSANAYLYGATAVGYFGVSAELNPLLHTWSLSVEEQFYFVIPVLLLAAWTFGRRRWRSLAAFRVVVAILFVSSLVACLWFSGSGDTVLHVAGQRFAFFSPITRAWEFAAGLFLAVVPTRFIVAARWRRWIVTAGVAMIVAAAFAYSDTTTFPGYAALVPVLGAALAIHAGTRARPPAIAPVTTPGLRPLIWFGDLSYSWYLWHWPVIVFAAAFWPRGGAVVGGVAAAASLLPAWLSYRALEQRVRARSTSTPLVRSTVVLAACCIAAPLVAAGLARPVTVWATAQAADRVVVTDALPDQAGEQLCNSLEPRGQRPPACTWGGPNAAARVVLIGDSTAAQLSNALIGAADANDARLEIVTRGGCPFGVQPFEWPAGKDTENDPSDCVRFYEESIRSLEADPPDVVVLSNATNNWVYGGGYRPTDPATGRPSSSIEATARIFAGDLHRTVRRLRDADVSVALVDAIPSPYSLGQTFRLDECSRLAVIVDTARCLSPSFAATRVLARHHKSDVYRANALNHDVAQRADATTWSFAAEICPHGQCRPVRDGRLVWRDAAHLSGEMSRTLIPTAAKRLRAALGGGAGSETTAR